jgi:hypothetical protein
VIRAFKLLMALALLCTVVGPLRSDLPSWAWSWWLLASVLGFGLLMASPARASTLHQGFGASGGESLRWHDRLEYRLGYRLGYRLWPAMAMLGAAGVIDVLMCLWHGGGWNILRQDGKVVLALPMAWAVMAVLGLAQQHGYGHGHGHQSTAVPDRGLHRRTAEETGAAGAPGEAAALHEALCWALGLQMAVALAVALCWPRAWLPATPIPWATAVALNMAVLAPLVLAPRGDAPPFPEGRAWRIGLGLAVLAGAVAVVLSRSRAAWLVLPWLGVLAVVFSPRRLPTAAATGAMAALALAAGLWYDSQQPAQVERGMRLLDLVQELTQLDQPDAGTSVGSRLLLWEAAWNSLWAHPWTGIGIEQRIALVQSVVPPETLRDVAPLVHVHQQYLNQAVDHGLPGLLAAVLGAAAPFALAWRAPSLTMRWQCLGVGVLHGVGLLFNANMTHGTYAVNVALSLMAIIWMQASTDATQGPHG